MESTTIARESEVPKLAADSAALIDNGEFEKYDVMRGCWPPVIDSLMNSKLNTSIIACRTRQSSKAGRREFITKPVIPEGR